MGGGRACQGERQGQAAHRRMLEGEVRRAQAPDPSELPELPEGWCAATLEQITSGARVICYGILMPKEHVPGGILYVKVKDLRGDRLDVSTLSRTHPEIAAKYERASLAAGDSCSPFGGPTAAWRKFPRA